MRPETTEEIQLAIEIRALKERQVELGRRLERTLSALESLASRGSPGPAGHSPEMGEIQDQLQVLTLQFTKMGEAIAAATQLTFENTTRIEEILHSRTWRILTGLGRLWLKIRGGT